MDFKSLRDRLAATTTSNTPTPPPPPPAPPRGKYEGIEGVRASMEKNYIRPGRYLFRVKAVKDGTGEKSHMDFFSVTAECLHVIANEGGLGNRQGEEIRWTVLDKPKTPYLANVKAFVCGATGFPDSEVTAGAIREIAGDGQPLAGAVVEVTARNKPKKNKPMEDFTVVQWLRPVSFSECKTIFTPEEVTRFWPGGALDKLAAAEAK